MISGEAALIGSLQAQDHPQPKAFPERRRCNKTYLSNLALILRKCGEELENGCPGVEAVLNRFDIVFGANLKKEHSPYSHKVSDTPSRSAQRFLSTRAPFTPTSTPEDISSQSQSIDTAEIEDGRWG